STNCQWRCSIDFHIGKGYQTIDLGLLAEHIVSTCANDCYLGFQIATVEHAELRLDGKAVAGCDLAANQQRSAVSFVLPRNIGIDLEQFNDGTELQTAIK